MLERIAKAFTYYNECYPKQTMIFRCESKYYLCSDSSTVSQYINAIETETLMIPQISGDGILCYAHVFNANMESKCIDILIQHGIHFKIITHRNNAGKHDIPDVDVIKQEKEDDY